MINLASRPGWHYLFVRLPFHKSLELGVQDVRQYVDHDEHFNWRLSLNFRGADHAGLKFFVQFWRVFFEFNLCDNRHWDYKANTWMDPNRVLDCDDGQDSVFLHGGEAQPGGSTYYKEDE